MCLIKFEVKASSLSKVSRTCWSKSRCIVVFFDSINWIKAGSFIVSWTEVSDLVRNNECSNDKSNWKSSKFDNYLGSEFSLVSLLILCWLSTLLFFLKILSRLSTIIERFGFGCALVYYVLLEARIFIFYFFNETFDNPKMALRCKDEI